MARKTAPKRVWHPTETAAESAIFRIFDIELRDVLGRLASAIDDFIGLVHVEFQHHPNACLVSGCRNQDVARADARVGDLTGDAQSLLDVTIDSFATCEPALSERLTCERVGRIKIPAGAAPPRRAMEVPQLLGWFSENERRLSGMLHARTPNVLERRELVDSLRQGFIERRASDGTKRIFADASLAQSDSTIANECPLLVRKDMAEYEMAVSDASIRSLRTLAEAMSKWRPRRERHRQLDPQWPELIHSLVKVTHHRSRGAASDGNQSGALDGGAEHPATAGLTAVLAGNRAGFERIAGVIESLVARDDDDTPAPSLPALKPWAFEAWQAKQVGMTVTAIAETLANKYNDPKITQPRVSEQIQRAQLHTKASGLAELAARALPQVGSKATARTLDPAAADQGKRTDSAAHYLRERERQKAKDGDTEE